jgi:hypothetical protein
MHWLTAQEIKRMNRCGEIVVLEFKQEMPAHLERNKLGYFDFFVRTPDKTIGFEVMSRPTKGKLREKLCYANAVDEFVFVLPHNALEFYLRRPRPNFYEYTRTKSFPHEFSSDNLYVWMLDLEYGLFKAKALFREVFNVVSR